MRRPFSMPGPEVIAYTIRLVAARNREIERAKRFKLLNAAHRAAQTVSDPLPLPRLDVTPLRLTKPEKMPHLRRACDEDDDS